MMKRIGAVALTAAVAGTLVLTALALAVPYPEVLLLLLLPALTCALVPPRKGGEK